jgi:hypothetical protein
MSEEFVGKVLVWEDPETGEEKTGEIYQVGPHPYLWVEGPNGDVGVPERDWIAIREAQ